jgi:hypothetical protein
MTRYARRRSSLARIRHTENGTPMLPNVRLRDPERAWPIWLLWHGLEKRYLPDEIERQDAVLLGDLLELENTWALVEEMLEHERKRTVSAVRHG